MDGPAPADAGPPAETTAPASAPDVPDADVVQAEGAEASAIIIIRATPPDAGVRADAATPPDADAADAPGCDAPEGPATATCLLSDEYGVFVASPGAGAEADSATRYAPDPDPADAGLSSAPASGTMRDPATTITEGIRIAATSHKKRLFVCNGWYSEHVVPNIPLAMYGGLSCAVDAAGARVWAYRGGQARVVSPDAKPALSLPGSSTPIRIEDMAFTAADAITPGGSSVAAAISSSTVSLRRVTLRAGRGADGAPGADGVDDPNYDPASPVAPGGSPPGLDDVAAPPGGQPGASNVCLHFGISIGGNGGAGCGMEGEGGSGTATPSPSTRPGRDGLGQGIVLGDGGAAIEDPAYASFETGDPGGDGTAGPGGAAPLDDGALLAQGWTASPGGDGSAGRPGQGGGGGMDDHHGPDGCTAPFSDHTGGSGAAGGCGGSPGRGGQGGGGSIALLAQASTIDLAECLLITSAGGAGGRGGDGQDGQAGGSEANPSAPYAGGHPGGPGGNGAGGSGGAGGAGGISVAIVVDASTQVTTDAFTAAQATLGVPGRGGAPGDGGRHGAGALPSGEDGAPGARGIDGVAVFMLGPR